VEFLYGLESKQYYFLELNPRLQVSHLTRYSLLQLSTQTVDTAAKSSLTDVILLSSLPDLEMPPFTVKAGAATAQLPSVKLLQHKRLP